MAHWFDNLARASAQAHSSGVSRRAALGGLIGAGVAGGMLARRPAGAFGQATVRDECTQITDKCLKDAETERGERSSDCYGFLDDCMGDPHANQGICAALMAQCDARAWQKLEEDRKKCLDEERSCCQEDNNCPTCEVCRSNKCVKRECPDCERCENDKCVSELRSNERCCFGSPRDVMSDPQNCGACGRTCPAGQPCRNGVCACPQGSATCVNIRGESMCCPPTP